MDEEEEENDKELSGDEEKQNLIKPDFISDIIRLQLLQIVRDMSPKKDGTVHCVHFNVIIMSFRFISVYKRDDGLSNCLGSHRIGVSNFDVHMLESVSTLPHLVQNFAQPGQIDW